MTLIGFVPALGTNGIEPIDASFQARARGGADVAVGDSALSQVNNPAALTLHRRPAFDFSGQLTFPDIEWHGPIDSARSEVQIVPLANMGLALPLSDRAVLGLAVHSKAGVASEYHMRHLLMPWVDRRVGSDSKCVGLHANIGFRATEKLSLGVGVRCEVATSTFSMPMGPADVSFGRGYAYGGGFQLGALYQATDTLMLGLAYRSPSWFGDLGGGSGRASLLGVAPVRLGAIEIKDLTLPQRIVAGAAWDATDWLKLVGEARWVNYDGTSYDKLTVATDGVFDLRVPLPLGYRDQWVFIVGAEIKLSERWTWSVGYNYGTDPVRPASLCPMASVLAQHHVTTGLRYTQDNWWVGVGYIAALSNSLEGTGRSAIPLGVDFAHSRIEQVQHSLITGFGFSW